MSAPMAGFGPMAWSPFPYGPIPSSGVPSLLYVDLFNAQTVAGAKTWQVAAQTGVAETIATFKVSDDATSYLKFGNNDATNSRLEPLIEGYGLNSSASGLVVRAQAGFDAGAVPVLQFHGRVVGPAALNARPVLGVYNHTNLVLSLLPLNSGANSALSWGTQSGAVPTLATSRSIGTRLVIKSAFIDGSATDYAIGTNGTSVMWYSVPQATSAYAHNFYGGSSLAASIRGDGLASVGAAITGSETLRVFATTNAAINVDVGSTNAVRLGVDASNIGYTGSTNATAFQVRTNGVSRVAFDTAGAAATFSVPVGVPSYTVATLPVATTAGRVIYVSDAAVAPCLAFTNGANWKRCDNAATTVV